MKVGTILACLLWAGSLVEGSRSWTSSSSSSSLPLAGARSARRPYYAASSNLRLNVRGGANETKLRRRRNKGLLKPWRHYQPKRPQQALAMIAEEGTESSAALTTNMQGVLFMALSSLSFSLMFLGVKLYSNAPTFTLIFYRSVVQAILSGILLLRDRSNPINGQSVDGVQGLLLARAGFGSLAVAAMFYSVQNLPLPDAITLQFTVPVFAALMAVPLLGEAWKRSDMVGAAFCLSGVLLIARPSWLFGTAIAEAVGAASATAALFATVVGLTGAAFAGLAYVLVRRIGDRSDANMMVFYYAMFSALTAPMGAKWLQGTGSWDVVGTPKTEEVLVFAALGVFGFLGQLFTNMGLTKCESAAIATLITNTQIVFAFLFEIFILHESISPWSIAGSGLIIGYMAFTGLRMAAKEKEPT